MDWYLIANGNVERHLGDVEAEDIYDEAFTLASDALKDAGCPASLIVCISSAVAQRYAQP